MRFASRRSLAVVLATLPTFAAFAAIGCSSSGSAGPGTGTVVAATVTRDVHPTVSSSASTALVTGNTDFAFSLYHGLSSGSTTTNLFFSPYSVSLALAMAYAGAHGATATQMATALSFTLPSASLNPAFDKLDLAIEAKPANATGADGAPFAINIADSLWGEETVTFQQDFVNSLAADFGASLRKVDFLNQSSAAEAAINSWVASETNDKIDPLLGPNAIGSATRFVIVNAVYFNAAWATQFAASSTQPGAFTRADGSTVQTPLMYSPGGSDSPGAATGYVKGANYQAVELPYSGNTTSMVVVLPDTGAYAAVEGSLSGSFFDSVTSSLSGAYTINLTLPSFKIHGGTVSLTSELEGLGMVDAFNPNTADFTAMIPAGGIYISDVLHQAFVDVDESGTEAAAATAVVGVADVATENPPPVVNVVANHAFFFFLRDLATNTVLFVGREDDPTAQ